MAEGRTHFRTSEFMKRVPQNQNQWTTQKYCLSLTCCQTEMTSHAF